MDMSITPSLATSIAVSAVTLGVNGILAHSANVSRSCGRPLLGRTHTTSMPRQ